MTKNRKPGGTDAEILADMPPHYAHLIAADTANPEDLEGASEALAAAAALTAGREERIPAEFAERIIDGENPLRVYREFRGLTQLALAEKSGVGRSYIADIERGTRDGTVSAYRKLADALGVLIDDLVD